MQKTALDVAAGLLIATGVAHSWLGERYILMRLFRRGELPKIFRSAEFTQRTLRFAWHVTSVAWWGFAAILFLIAHGRLSAHAAGIVIACTFLAHGAIALVGSRARHLSWIVFLAVALLTLLAVR